MQRVDINFEGVQQEKIDFGIDNFEIMEQQIVDLKFRIEQKEFDMKRSGKDQEIEINNLERSIKNLRIEVED